MATIDIPDTLLALERSAWEAIQRGELTVATALKVHEGIAAFAEASGETRIAVEERIKQTVRHPDAG